LAVVRFGKSQDGTRFAKSRHKTETPGRDWQALLDEINQELAV